MQAWSKRNMKLRRIATCSLTLFSCVAFTQSLSAQDYYSYGDEATSQTSDLSEIELVKLSGDQLGVVQEAQRGSEDPQLTNQEFFLTSASSTVAASSCCAAAGCTDGSCGCACKAAASKAAANSHKVLFFTNNFDYLCDSCYDDCLLGDRMKKRSHGNLSVDVGGQYRYRFHSEDSMRGGAPGVLNDFGLHRTRVYADVKSSYFRAYAEYIDAVSIGEDIAPRGIDENRSDLLNLFGEVKLLDNCRGQLTARVGRQEMLYGKQRAVSPLDWANTRRTFEGYKLMWQGQNWDTDVFWLNPLNVNVDRFDSPNQDQEFYGVHATNKSNKDLSTEVFWYGLNNDAGAGFRYDTLGARLAGSNDYFMWEAWSAIQWGTNGANNHEAGAWTASIGREFECVAWKPVLWLNYDWASGSSVVGNGFHHQFPLAHAYLGWMDFFGRRNIEDFNAKLVLSPSERVQLIGWWHLFNRQNGNDTPYDVGMNSYGTAAGSQYLGQELDLMAKIKLTSRSNLLFGYSHFFSGSYFDANPGLAFANDADFFYTQFTVNF